MTVLDKFKKVTNYDLSKYLDDTSEFFVNSVPDIVSYYNGNFIKKTVFTDLVRLYKESKKVDTLINVSNSSLSSNTGWWDLVETLSEIRTKLETVQNLAKWLRSSYVFGWEKNTKVEIVLGQYSTLEDVSTNLGNPNPNEDWAEIAVANNLLEGDYTKAGGNVLSISKQDNKVFNTESVVDVMVGDNILGKDLPKKLTINDLDIGYLSTAATMQQSAEILLNIVKGSVLEFPYLGVSQKAGTSLFDFKLSSVGREVQATFKTDDSFKSVQMGKSGKESEDAYSYEFFIVSRLNNEIALTL